MISNRQVFRPKKVEDEFLQSNGARVGGNSAWRYVVPDNGSSPSFGGETIYKLKSFGSNLLRNCYLKFKVSALTASVGAAEWSNMLAITLWDRIEVVSNGQTVHQLHSSTALQTIRKIFDSVHYDNVIADLIADLSEADRQTNAGSEQELYFPLGIYFSMLSASFPIYLLNERDTEIHVNFRQLSDCVINGDSATITDTRLEALYTDAGNQVVSRINNIVNNNHILRSRGINAKGWHLQSNWYDRQTEQLASGSSTFQVFLPSLANQWVKSIHFTVHANSDLASGIYDNFVAVSKFSLKSGGAYLSMQEVDTTDRFYNTVVLASRQVPGRDKIKDTANYGIYYTDALYAEFSADKKRANAGSYDFRNIRDAQLTLEFDSNLASNHTCIVSIVRHQEEIITNGAIRQLMIQNN